jgi:hypothetical protein
MKFPCHALLALFVLGASRLLGPGLPRAAAEMIPSDVTVTQDGNNFTFNYSMKVLGTSQLQSGDYGVLYDVPGLDANTLQVPFGWSVTTSLIGPTPTQVHPEDNPHLANIKFTYTNPAVISPGNTTILIPGFSYQSSFGDIGQADFASFTHLDPDSTHPHGRQVSNVTTVDVPKGGEGPDDTPEPATLVLLVLGLPCVGGMTLVRRRLHPVPG